MRLEKVLYYTTAILCLLGMLAHELLGGPSVLPPLDQTELSMDVIWLFHFSWHVASIALMGIMFLFLYAARHIGNFTVAFIASATLAGFALLGITLAVFGNAALWSTPAPYIWIIISTVGFAGVYVEKSRLDKAEAIINKG